MVPGVNSLTAPSLPHTCTGGSILFWEKQLGRDSTCLSLWKEEAWSRLLTDVGQDAHGESQGRAGKMTN